MAASAQQTNPQQPQLPPQRRNETNPSTQNLDNLQAMFNLVLITTGRFLREQQTGGGSGRMQYTLQRSVTAAKERFHDSLDQLEDQLQLAQAVVRRDLARLQQERIKREQAEQAERQRRAAESSAKKDVGAKKQTGDTTAGIVGASADNANSQNPLLDPSAKGEDAEPSMLHRAQSPPPPIETSLPPARDPLFDETPVTASAPDIRFDFEAEFGDGMGDGMNDHHQDIDMNDVASDMHLLAGLEDFAKGGDDKNTNTNTGANRASNNDTSTVDLDLEFAMSDLLEMNTNTEEPTAPTNPPTPPKPAEPTPPPQQPADTSNDIDMLGGTAANDDFDDLFNMDYIENPEDTQFNDAFYGYE